MCRPSRAEMLRSISLVTSGNAGAPSEAENFIPQYSGGLWLAVKLIAPLAPLARTAYEIAGVGVAPSHTNAWSPLAEIIRADSDAKRSAMNRVSQPMITFEPGALRLIQFAM